MINTGRAGHRALPGSGILPAMNMWEVLLRVRWWIWHAVGGVLGVLFIVFGVPAVGPAWSAHTGGGTPGTFTAVQESCGRRSCTWTGEFRPNDGGSPRTDIEIADGGTKITAVGDRVLAVDTGGPVVYPPGGGDDW